MISRDELLLECGAEHDRVVILECDERHRATKRWTSRDGLRRCEPYDAGSHFRVSQEPVFDLGELAALLERLLADPSAFVIRGEPLPGVVGSICRRRAHTNPDGYPPRFAASWRRWVALDFDKVETDRAFDLTRADETREAIAFLRGLLSPEFRAAACFGTLTSSAGIAPKANTLSGFPRVSARLWFWLDRPVGTDELTRWAEQTGAPVDVAVFRTVQPIYTAAPLFDGMADPIAERGVLLGGAPMVALEAYKAQPKTVLGSTDLNQPYRRQVDSYGSADDEHGRRYARGALEKRAAELASAPEGTRNDALFKAGVRLGGLTPGRWLTRSEIAYELTAAARANGDARERADIADTIARAIEIGASKHPWEPPAPRARRRAA